MGCHSDEIVNCGSPYLQSGMEDNHAIISS